MATSSPTTAAPTTASPTTAAPTTSSPTVPTQSPTAGALVTSDVYGPVIAFIVLFALVACVAVAKKYRVSSKVGV